jgi:hypothetical protein
MLSVAAVETFFSAITFALTLLLVFKTNSCYARWWEARSKVGLLTSTAHDLARAVSQRMNLLAVLMCICSDKGRRGVWGARLGGRATGSVGDHTVVTLVAPAGKHILAAQQLHCRQVRCKQVRPADTLLPLLLLLLLPGCSLHPGPSAPLDSGHDPLDCCHHVGSEVHGETKVTHQGGAARCATMYIFIQTPGTHQLMMPGGGGGGVRCLTISSNEQLCAVLMSAGCNRGGSYCQQQ